MRLIKQNIRKKGSGTVMLMPEVPEDMWHAYNLIRQNDIITAPAIRRVKRENATGSTVTNRVHTTLQIVVTSVDFDAQAGQLHVSGKVAEENEYVDAGQYHTLDLELNRNFTLEKSQGWDSVSIDVVREAIDPRKGAEVVAVVMQDGLANICLITEHQTILQQRLETTIPRKRQGRIADHEKGLTKFFQTLYETLLRHVDFEVHKAILLASPGFTAASFQKFVFDTASSSQNKALLSNREKFIVIHSSSGHLHALNEVLKSPEVLARLKDTKFATESRSIDEFHALLRKDDGRAWYGPKEVTRAVEKGAVGRGGGLLLISNQLFRSQEIAIRARWVALVDKVKEQGGEVRVFSSQHESGKRLEGLGGIAAILTFPLDDLDEGDDDEDDEAERNAETSAGDIEPIQQNTASLPDDPSGPDEQMRI